MPGRDLFGFDDGGVVEAEVEGVGFFVDVEFHGLGVGPILEGDAGGCRLHPGRMDVLVTDQGL